MCTLAWGKHREGLWVCFNRDERRTRPRAEPPAVYAMERGSLIYARDPLGGGTWFAASTSRFAVALLNHYPSMTAEFSGNHLSRGQLVLKVAATGSAEAAMEGLLSENLDRYAPFHLFLISEDFHEGRTWDQHQLKTIDPEAQFWTTSSYRSDEVVQWRKITWEAAVSGKPLDAKRAGEIFRRTHPDDPAYGLTMDREDARTVSQIELDMSPQSLIFKYSARDPGGPGYLDARTIEMTPPPEDVLFTR